MDAWQAIAIRMAGGTCRARDFSLSGSTPGRPSVRRLHACVEGAAVMSLIYSAHVKRARASRTCALERLPTPPARRIDGLLPHRWSHSDVPYTCVEMKSHQTGPESQASVKSHPASPPCGRTGYALPATQAHPATTTAATTRVHRARATRWPKRGHRRRGSPGDMFRPGKPCASWRCGNRADHGDQARTRRVLRRGPHRFEDSP